MSTSAIHTLNQSIKRQVDLLPTEYLRQFFRIKLGDDVEKLSNTHDHNGLRTRRFKKVTRELRKLESANMGKKEAMSHVLDLAYGRKGKLRRELIEPLLDDPLSPLPKPIIPAVEKSRPPVYSAELTALLTSTISRTAKALRLKDLEHPTTLPSRADPKSEEARLLGPFSKRRLVNLHQRFLKDEEKKVLPPLQLQDGSSDSSKADVATLNQLGVRGFGLQGTGVLEEAIAIAGPPCHSQTTRRERRLSATRSIPADSEVLSLEHASPQTSSASSSVETHLPRRWVRRRYRELLYTVPILSYDPDTTQSEHKGRYTVSLASSAVGKATQGSFHRIPEVDIVDKAWM
ncbi:hypothetical protein C8Q75DRAFT_868039 [Abortiporus biennis]|nr:hypothetical protein C8Q75DRAFT_868039 [Abortiporus biennis]